MFKKFDSHTHVYPPEIVEKATHNLGKFYDFTVDSYGTLEDLESQCRKNGVDGFLILSVATNAHQVEKVNTYAADCVVKAKKDGFIAAGFMAMHQDFPDMEREVDRAISLGLSGIKLHPDIQAVDVDDKRLMPLYEIASSKGIPVYFHSGDDRAEYRYSEPKKIAYIAETFPSLRIAAAHLGGYKAWDESLEYLAGRENVWYDTSSALWAMSVERADHIISKLGTERLMFATDYPTVTMESEIERFTAVTMSPRVREEVYFGNAMRLLDLEDNI